MIGGKKEKAAQEQGRTRAIRCPQKKGINLNMREQQTGAAVTLIVGIAVIFVLVCAVAKFGVIDQYQRLSKAQGEYTAVHQTYVNGQKELEDYDQVLMEYRTYSRDWMEGEDETGRLVSVDRIEVLDLVEAHMMNRGSVTSLEVQGETAQVSMTGMTLDEISRMFADLQAQPIVASVELNLAETEKDMPASILSFSMNITLQPAAEEETK